MKHCNRRIGFLSVVAMLAMGLSASGAAISWTGLDTNSSWSNTNNWDLQRAPTVGDAVTFGISNSLMPAVVDSPVTVDSITFNNVAGMGGALSYSGSGTLTAALITKKSVGSGVAYGNVITVPLIIPAGGMRLSAENGGGWNFDGQITGTEPLTLGGGDQMALRANNTNFSGNLIVSNAHCRMYTYTACIGTGPITLGVGSGLGSLFLQTTAITYGSPSQTITVEAGTGTRQIYSQTVSLNATIAPNWVLNTNLTFSLAAGAKCTLSGAISGSGGIVKNDSISTTGILAGACTYLGATRIEQGTLILNGTMSNVNFAIGHTNIVSLVNGTGTNWFRDGNTIDVNTNGTLDATLLKFDLTRLTTNVAVLVDYSHSGTFTGPTPLQDMFTPASLRSFTVTDTASQVVATRKPKGMVFSVY